MPPVIYVDDGFDKVQKINVPNNCNSIIELQFNDGRLVWRRIMFHPNDVLSRKCPKCGSRKKSVISGIRITAYTADYDGIALKNVEEITTDDYVVIAYCARCSLNFTSEKR